METEKVAKVVGLTALALAVISLFMCTPIAVFLAAISLIAGGVAFALGARGVGIATIIVSLVVLIFAAASFFAVSKELEKAGAELEKELKAIEGKCIFCGGKGVADCPLCVNGRTPDGYACLGCGGRGYVVCTFCNGTGKPTQ